MHPGLLTLAGLVATSRQVTSHRAGLRTAPSTPPPAQK